MNLKNQLIDTYQKASLEKNNLILENVINRWAHRFGIESLDELIVKNQEQINLKEEDQVEENQEQINLFEDQVEENQEQIDLKEEDQVEENQEQIDLKEEDQAEENQEQIDLKEEDQAEVCKVKLEVLENIHSQEEINSKLNSVEKSNNQIITKGENESYENKSKFLEREELPLPNINNLRKWINNDKKAC